MRRRESVKASRKVYGNDTQYDTIPKINNKKSAEKITAENRLKTMVLCEKLNAPNLYN